MKLTKQQTQVIVDSILLDIKNKNSKKREEFLNNLTPELDNMLTEVGNILAKIGELEDRLVRINEDNNIELSIYNLKSLDVWKDRILNKYFKIATPSYKDVEREVILATIDFEGSIDDFIKSIADRLSND